MMSTCYTWSNEIKEKKHFMNQLCDVPYLTDITSGLWDLNHHHCQNLLPPPLTVDKDTSKRYLLFFKTPFLGSCKTQNQGWDEGFGLISYKNSQYTCGLNSFLASLVGGATTQWERGLDWQMKACVCTAGSSIVNCSIFKASGNSLQYKSFTHIQHPDRLIYKYGQNSTTDRRKWREHKTRTSSRTKPAKED